MALNYLIVKDFKRKQPSRVSFRALGLALLSLLALFANGLATASDIPGVWCNAKVSGDRIVGIGSSTQATVQASLFIQKYEDLCPNARGYVSYQGSGDKMGVFHATVRTHGFTFYAMDIPLSSYEKAFIENDTSGIRGRFSPVHQIPVLLDGIAIGYNLGSTTSCASSVPVKFRSSVLSGIYSGAIRVWNHPSIVLDNPQLRNCTLTMKPVVRDEEDAGPTIVFKDYLSKRNPQWNALKQKPLNKVWPITLPTECPGVGDGGMATCLGEGGSIAYLGYGVAKSRGVKVGAVENFTGQFVTPAADVVNTSWPDNCPPAAAAAIPAPPQDTLQDWSAVSLTDPAAGYPICTFSYGVAFQNIQTAYFNTLTSGQVRNTVDYLSVIVGDTVQNQLPSFGYAALPEAIQLISQSGVRNIHFR